MSLLNISSEILDDPFFIETVEFLITENKSDSRGNPLEITESKTHKNTNVQPATGSTLLRLPEGERETPSMQVFTKSSFPIKNGDYMLYDGKKWRCMTEDNWSKYGHYDSIFVRYKESESINSETPDPFA